MNRKKLNPALILLVLPLSACTNQGIYTFIQGYEQSGCIELPRDQYEECMERTAETYEDYERKRKEAGEDG